MLQVIRDSKLIKIPEAVLADYRKMNQVEDDFLEENGCYPEYEELAALCKMTIKKIRTLKSLPISNIDWTDLENYFGTD
jgi:DNA-directed RNA polymerase specialized sigma subunit